MQGIPEDKSVLLFHPEGCNKIQDGYNSEDFISIGKHPEPTVYYVKPVNDKGHV